MTWYCLYLCVLPKHLAWHSLNKCLLDKTTHAWVPGDKREIQDGDSFGREAGHVPFETWRRGRRSGGTIGPQKSGGLDKAKLWIAAAAPMATKGVRLWWWPANGNWQGAAPGGRSVIILLSAEPTMGSEVGGVKFQDTAELRASLRNHSFIYSYFGEWEKMWRRKKIIPLQQIGSGNGSGV